MKFNNCLSWKPCSVFVGLAAAWLLTIAVPAVAVAQSTAEITITGADGTFKQGLARPEALFETLGLAADRVRQALQDRQRVLVTDAGAMRTVGMVPFTDLTPPAAPIDIQGAGSTRNIVVRLVPDLQNSNRLPLEVQIKNAGTVREVQPEAPTFLLFPQEP